MRDDAVALVVEDVGDAAIGVAVEADGSHVVKLDAEGVGGFDGAVGDDGGVPEDAVDAEAPRLVIVDGVGDFVGGEAANTVVGPGTRARRIIGHFGLVEIDPATLAVPEGLVALAVLDEKAIHRDIVTINDKSLAIGIFIPSCSRAVVGAPEPEVVADDVVGVDGDEGINAAGSSAAGAAEDVVETRGIAAMIRMIAERSDFQQCRRTARAGVKKNPGDFDAIDVGDSYGGSGVGGNECGVAKAKDDGVGALDADGLVEVIDAGTEDQIFSGSESRVDHCSIIAISVSEKELVEGNCPAWIFIVRPIDSPRIGPRRRNHHRIFSGGIDEQIRLFGDGGSCWDDGKGAVGPLAPGSAIGADEDHIEATALPLGEIIIAGEPLLLGAGVDQPIDFAVGKKTAAGPAAVPEIQVPKNVNATERGALGDGPDHRVIGWNNGEVLGIAPEIARGVAVHPFGGRAQRADDLHIIGRLTETEGLGVEAHS